MNSRPSVRPLHLIIHWQFTTASCSLICHVEGVRVVVIVGSELDRRRSGWEGMRQRGSRMEVWINWCRCAWPRLGWSPTSWARTRQSTVNRPVLAYLGSLGAIDCTTTTTADRSSGSALYYGFTTKRRLWIIAICRLSSSFKSLLIISTVAIGCFNINQRLKSQ